MSIEREWRGRLRVYIPTCDMCGAQLAEQYDFNDAVEAKRSSGWKSKKIDGEWIDLCDDCKCMMRGKNDQN